MGNPGREGSPQEGNGVIADVSSARTVKAEDVQALPWWHSINLGNGIVTPGKKPMQLLATEASIAFKYPVAGKTVLDVGAWDGFFSFEARRRGAARVLATDLRSWSGLNWGNKASFDLARDALGYEVEDRVIDVYDMTPAAIGTFDVVLFLGVLYHLKNPFGALENIASIASEMLVVETRLDATKVRLPVMRFYKGPLDGDANNWWAPNRACMLDMLAECGFYNVEFTQHPEHPDRGFFHAFRGDAAASRRRSLLSRILRRPS